MMKITRLLAMLLAGFFCLPESQLAAQPGGGRRGGPPNPQGDPSSTVSPLPPGEAGIAWYATWDLAREEAIRSNRPILFMSAASQCNGVPGVF